MKSTYIKYLVLMTMALAIFLGSQEPEESLFANVHAGLAIPLTNELNEDCSCATASPKDLWSPSTVPVNDYERKLFKFILDREYAKSGWCVDKKVRDTGPQTTGTYYGVHPAVRMYYSPRMMYWLTGDPKYWKDGKVKKRKPRTGPVPDGAIVIKEMFHQPADIYDEMKRALDEAGECNEPAEWDALLAKLIMSYTIMVKDKKGSHEGWFYSQLSPPGEGETIEETIQKHLTNFEATYGLGSGFNLPCSRCHASAAVESTFSALINIEGFKEDENLLSFQKDVSWKVDSLLYKWPLKQIPDGGTCVGSETVKELEKLLQLPPMLRPWQPAELQGYERILNMHMEDMDPLRNFATANPLDGVNPDFAAMFPNISASTKADARAFPFQWADHVVPEAGKVQHYITSDNCLGCHGGLGGVPYDVTMFVQTGPNYGDGYNISEFGEWRWSPMGLAGRDPIFYAQLETEMQLLIEDSKKRGTLKDPLDVVQQNVINTCTSCHGAMGQRQLEKDALTNPHLDPNFKIDYVYLTEALTEKDKKQPNYQYHEYGELAREGISCAVCHHIEPPTEEEITNWKPRNPDWLKGDVDKELAYGLFHNNTGRYNEGPADEFNGPFKDVATFPMENALGIKPVHNDFITNSQMCGTCHTINLPNIGATKDKFPVLTAAETNPVLKKYPHSIEQATFLEWQNSAFGFTVDNRKGADFQTCQDCHMPNSFETLSGDVKIDQITSKIATIQDQDYTEVDHRAATDDIYVQPRTNYKRHELVGLNVFLLEMFDQFPDVLGVEKTDFMTYATNGNSLAIENMVRQAREMTVDIDVSLSEMMKDTLPININIQNKTGHRFPSGVAFRRAFLEVLVMEGNTVIWGSGRTNSAGVIVDENGKPLKTEFLPNKNTYQPHYQVVRDQREVQIYEELTTDANNDFTFSFIHRVHHIKDNRLLPKGWRFSGKFASQGQLMQQFMAATDPDGVGKDPDYRDQGVNFPGGDNVKYHAALPAGTDMDNLTVKVTMYYQAIPPFWLHEKFTTAPDGEATKRLFYLTSHLNLEGTFMEDWKLPLVTKKASYKKMN